MDRSLQGGPGGRREFRIRGNGHRDCPAGQRGAARGQEIELGRAESESPQRPGGAAICARRVPSGMDTVAAGRNASAVMILKRSIFRMAYEIWHTKYGNEIWHMK